jgi:hypothetical protein
MKIPATHLTAPFTLWKNSYPQRLVRMALLLLKGRVICGRPESFSPHKVHLPFQCDLYSSNENAITQQKDGINHLQSGERSLLSMARCINAVLGVLRARSTPKVPSVYFQIGFVWPGGRPPMKAKAARAFVHAVCCPAEMRPKD